MKRIFITMISLALIVSFLGGQKGSASVDYAGGILDGESINLTSSSTSSGTPTYALTDNNEDTFEVLAKWESSSSSTATDHAVKSFDSAIIVNSLRISATGTLRLYLYNASGSAISIEGKGYLTISADSADGRLITFPQTAGVRKFALFNPSTSSSVTLKEFQLYNLVAPSDAVILQGTAGDAIVNLNWNSIDGATGYTLKRATSTGGPYTTIQTTTETSYVDTNVINGITYYYIVTAINSAGESAPSNEVAVTPEKVAIPPALGHSALLTIYLDGGIEKEYELSAEELEHFYSWFDQKDQGNGPARYAFEKSWNKGPFSKRTDYIIYDKIITFEVSEY